MFRSIQPYLRLIKRTTRCGYAPAKPRHPARHLCKPQTPINFIICMQHFIIVQCKVSFQADYPEFSLTIIQCQNEPPISNHMACTSQHALFSRRYVRSLCATRRCETIEANQLHQRKRRNRHWTACSRYRSYFSSLPGCCRGCPLLLLLLF